MFVGRHLLSVESYAPTDQPSNGTVWNNFCGTEEIPRVAVVVVVVTLAARLISDTLRRSCNGFKPRTR